MIAGRVFRIGTILSLMASVASGAGSASAGSAAASYPDLQLLVPKVPVRTLEDIEITAWARGYGEVLTAEQRRLEKFSDSDSQGTLVVISRGCRADRTYILRGADHVSLPVTPEPGTCDSPRTDSPRTDSHRTVTIHPAVRVEGELLPPQGDQLTGYGELTVVHCRGNSHEPRRTLGTFPFAIEKLSPEDRPQGKEIQPPGLGTWFTVIPAECVDLELITGDFAQLNLRKPTLRPRETVSLGRHQLKYAATLLVRLTDADGGAIAKADLQLIPADDLNSHIWSSPSAFSRAQPPSRLPAAAVTDSRGWARLENLDAGLFHLEVHTSQRPAFYSEPIEIEPRLVTTLDPLRLPRGAELEVLLEGIDSASASAIEHIAVQLSRVDDHGENLLMERRESTVRLYNVAEEPTQAHEPEPHVDTSIPGRALFRQMTPGIWTAHAMARVAGEPFLLRFGHSQIRLESGVRQSLRMEYRFHQFRGRVTLEGEGAAARGNISCDVPGCRVGSPKIITDDEGRFTLLLEHPGPYSANIRLDPGSDRSAVVSGLRFEDPDEEVEIVVDDQVLKAFVDGEVTYASGEPAVGVYVQAQGLPINGRRRNVHGLSTGTAMTDDFGHFELRNLAPGEWRITAKEEELSGGLTIQLEGKERSSVQLIIEEKIGWTASVVAGSLPVAGVQGRLSPVQANGLLYQQFFQTDDDGRFELPSPPTPGGLLNVALTPTASTPAAALRVVATDGMLIDVPRQRGAVRFLLADSSAPQIDFSNAVLLADDGAWLPLSMAEARAVRPDAGFSGAALEVPHLAVGRWRLVVASTFREFNTIAAGQGMGLPALAIFTVVAGQWIEVEIGSTDPSPGDPSSQDDREGDAP